MELGNAFSEINDAEEQASASRPGRRGRAGDDPDYVEALSYGMPPTGGLGFGVDRLAMVLGGQDNIRDVILFPALRERGRMTRSGVPSARRVTATSSARHDVPSPPQVRLSAS